MVRNLMEKCILKGLRTKLYTKLRQHPLKTMWLSYQSPSVVNLQ